METEKLKRRWEKQDHLEVDAAVSALFDHAHGRRLLWWLLDIGRVGGQPFTQNSLMTAFNCGELNVGQRILDRMLAVSPDGYVDLLKEKQNERNSRDAELGHASDLDRGWDAHGRDVGDGGGDSSS